MQRNSGKMILVAIGYTLSGLLIWLLEFKRTRKQGPDLLTLFMVMVVIQVVLPSIILCTIKTFYGTIDTGVTFTNRVINSVGFFEIATTLVLFLLFMLSLYFSWCLMDYHLGLSRKYRPKIMISVSSVRWLMVMLMGLGGFFVLINEFGGYANLILFRTEWQSPEKTFLTANLFSLSPTFLLLSLMGLVKFREKKLSIQYIFSLVCAVSFAAMTVSRRAILIIILLLFFVKLLENRKPLVDKWMVVFLFLSVPILLFGKSLLWRLSHQVDISSSIFSSAFDGGIGAVAKLAATIGITNIESWATLLYLHLPMRFGVDFLLSILRRIPEKSLGLDIDFPERMVRIATTAFVGSNAADIPPGFIGQMWLDFGMLGPIFWGIGFAIIIALLQLLYNTVRMERSGVICFVLLMYVVTLPVRSGTFDFVFSVNVFFLMVFMGFIVRIRVFKMVIR